MSLHTNNRHNRQTEYIRAREGVSESSDSRIVSTPENKRLTLTSILEPDAFALQWAHAVRDRFPNAKPLWGESSVGAVGRDPTIGSVPWRDWWEGLV